MEFKGTKGKWKVERVDDTFIRSENNEVVAQMPHNGIIKYETMPYNAQLISKAPEMLEMLKSIVEDFEGDYVIDGNVVDNPYPWLIDRYKEAKQLIKEATIEK